MPTLDAHLQFPSTALLWEAARQRLSVEPPQHRLSGDEVHAAAARVILEADLSTERRVATEREQRVGKWLGREGEQRTESERSPRK